jgi:hypothetical protein
MTSPLRKKRLTILRARKAPLATAVSLFGCVLLAAGAAQAQHQLESQKGDGVLANNKTIVYTREAVARPHREIVAPEPVVPRGLQLGPVVPPRPPSYTTGLLLTVGQEPSGKEDLEFRLRTDLPGPDRLFERSSEKQLFERIKREAGPTRAARVIFPEEEVLTKDKYAPRLFPRAVHLVEPNFVCHGRLYFEQPNFERHGWDLGLFQPAVSLGAFYWDVATLPYQLGTRPFQKYECSAGKCLPGDPVPLLWYPPELSWSGLAAQTGAVTAGFFIFP